MTGSAANSTLTSGLSEGLVALGLDIPAGAQHKLIAYLEMLQKWNRTYNLTAIRRPADMLVQHLLDSLAVLNLKNKLIHRSVQLPGQNLRVADVGSGAGLPGIPWAIAEREWQVTSIESVEKKAAFQRQVKIELDLSNLEVLAARVENIEGRTFDLVVSRAFSSLVDFVASAGHLVSPLGSLCAMKGVKPDHEMRDLPADWVVSSVDEVRVPGLDAQRHVLTIRRKS